MGTQAVEDQARRGNANLSPSRSAKEAFEEMAEGHAEDSTSGRFCMKVYGYTRSPRSQS